MYFEFNSGGAYHPEGLGAWKVRIEGDRLRIEHQVRDGVTRFPEATLTRRELSELEELIRAADLAGMPRSSDSAVPDQTEASFRIGKGDQARLVKIWLTSKDDRGALMKLVRRLADLIEKTTGKKPVLS